MSSPHLEEGLVLQGVDSLQNRRAVLHILLQGQQVDGQERHACLRKEKMHSPEPQHRSAKQRRVPWGGVWRRSTGEAWPWTYLLGDGLLAAVCHLLKPFGKLHFWKEKVGSEKR